MFDKLFLSNDNQRINIKGHQTGEHSASINSQLALQELVSRLEGDTAVVPLEFPEIVMWHDPIAMRRIKDDFSFHEFMQKKNPLQDKYFKLTRADDENVARELQPKP